MKNRASAIVLICVLAAGGVVWWFLQSPTPAPEPDTPKPAEPAPVKPVTQIAAPIAPPVAAHAPQPAAAPPAAAGGVQAELKTTISDIATLVESGDMVTVLKTYLPPDKLAQLPPEALAGLEQQQQQQAHLPEVQQTNQSKGQALEALKDQAPEMNAAGDEATYQMQQTSPDGTPRQSRVTFVKIDGKWYLKTGF